MKRLLKSRPRSILYTLFLVVALLACCPAYAQQASMAPPPRPAQTTANADFLAAADEVLQEMSEITGLKLRTPLKKTLRSREEIRAYVLKQMDEDKNPAERYAGARMGEAFGLLPKGFDLDAFMVNVLTEQIEGLYDPKAREFYIADWIPIDDQRIVMAHEMTHALEDQHFQIEAWMRAARPNDDAELAREAVLEGSAMVAMIDYELQGSGMSLKNLPDVDFSMLFGNLDMKSSPVFKSAPPFLQDALIFPYVSGLSFSSAVLKSSGWSGLPAIFEKPPLSTQQILHPALYRSGKTPEQVSLPAIDKLLGPGWTKLEENILGEFGWKEVLKQFLGAERATALSAAWEGDRYILYEQKQTKRLVLFTHLRLASDDQAARFFGQYSEALEKKYAERSNLFRRPNFFSFSTPEGNVFLQCVGVECITLEGASRQVFDAIGKSLNWPLPPQAPALPDSAPVKIAGISRPASVELSYAAWF